MKIFGKKYNVLRVLSGMGGFSGGPATIEVNANRGRKMHRGATC